MNTLTQQAVKVNDIPAHVDTIPVASATGHVWFMVRDGVYFNPEINEYEVWLDNEVASYATTPERADGYYLDALAARKDHYEAGNDDIPFDGQPCPIDDSHQSAADIYGAW